MTKSEEAQAIIYGSFILYAIDSLLDRSQHSNGTTIRLKQMLWTKTRKAQNAEYVTMSNKAWQAAIDIYKDKEYRIAIFDFVESIGFEVMDLMTEMFGSKFIDNISAFALKQTRDGVSKEILLESREISRALIRETRKVVFDNKGKL